MNFEIKNTKLSTRCRNLITALLREKNIKCNEQSLFDAIEQRLVFFAKVYKKTKRPNATAQRIKNDLNRLANTLTNIHPDVMDELSGCYLAAYPMPQPGHPLGMPYKPGEEFTIFLRIMNQTSETHLMRVDKPGIEHGMPIQLDELMGRIQKTCAMAEKNYSPRKGAPRDWLKVRFTLLIIDIFEIWTKRDATPVPNAVFDIFFGYILADVTNEKPDAQSHRKLIEAAISCGLRPKEKRRTLKRPMSDRDDVEMIRDMVKSIYKAWQDQICV